MGCAGGDPAFFTLMQATGFDFFCQVRFGEERPK